MKLKLTILFSALMLLVFFTGCKKKAGPGGKNSISGSIIFKNGTTGNNDAAPMATVSIAYGTNESTTTFDQAILTNPDGTFIFNGLNKGKYFIKAGYTDSHGFYYTSSGYGIIFEKKKSDLEVNINLE